MSVVELLGIMGLAMVAAYAAAWTTHLGWPRNPVRSGGGRIPAPATNEFRNAYVSETTPAYFQYVRRRYRYAVHCPVRYHVDEHVGEGLVVDMTRAGWRVRGQEGMRLGMVLRLDVTLPGAMEAISVSRAVVCWVRGAEFGVKLEAMDLYPASELSEFFSTLPQVGVFVPKAA